MSHDTEELCLMTLKSDAKLEERLLVPKMTWGIWWILMWAVACLKFALWCATFVENICLSQKKYRGVMCNNTEEWSKIWRGTDLCFENDVRNLGNFEPTLKICTLMEFFWPKYVMFELKKYRGVMNHYTEDRCKLWKKNDLWFYKWHEELVNFTGALKNLKICILRDFFVQVI